MFKHAKIGDREASALAQMLGMKPKEKEMASELARGKAAQAWCKETTSHKEMDVDLAEAFAEILDEIWSNPHRGVRNEWGRQVMPIKTGKKVEAMIYFRDMSFCSDAEECANAQGCGRNFDDEQKAAAKRWWGSDDAPVAFMSFKETCELFKDKK